MIEFKLPDVGEGLHEAEILEWLVQPGDRVTLDQPIVDIQTDKATVQIPAPSAGVIREIRAAVGKLARVGDVLVVIDPETSPPAAPSPPVAEALIAPTSPTSQPNPTGRVLAAPAVRKYALDHGINLQQVTGSGPAGRVTLDDVKRYAEQPISTTPVAPTVAAPAAPVAATPVTATPTEPSPTHTKLVLHGLRRRIAERMEQANQIPQATVFEEVDASSLVKLRDLLQPEAERQGVRLTYTALLIPLIIQSLKEQPQFNATYEAQQHELLIHHHYAIGVATAIDDGLVVPVVHRAEGYSMLALCRELQRLTEAARERRLSLSELTGSSFTLTNFGSFGGLQGTPILNPPEVAILGVGRIEPRPRVVEDTLAIRPTLNLALTFDHRVIDGAGAARFLRRLAQLIHQPELLILLR